MHAISRRQLNTVTKLTSQEADLEAPDKNGSPTEDSNEGSGAASAPRTGGRRNPFRLSIRAVVALLVEIIIGTALGLLVISVTIVLEHRDVIHFQSAHNFRDASLRLLGDPETIANMEDSSGFIFMNQNTYESYMKEINGAEEEVALRREYFEEKTAKSEENHKRIETDMAEFERLTLWANAEFKLDKFCGECKWKKSGTSCDDRVRYLKQTYGTGSIEAKISAIGSTNNCLQN